MVSEFGQDSTLRNMPYDFVNPGFTKSHRSLDNIVSLENRITYEIVRLYNCAVADKGFGRVWRKLGLKNRVQL